MKYKTFRTLVVIGLVAVGGFGIWRWNRAQLQRQAEDDAYSATRYEHGPIPWPQSPVSVAADAPAPTGEQWPPASWNAANNNVPGLAGSVGGQSPEAYLIATLGGPASEEKLKDVTGGQGSKINVYNEGGKWARAKVDHDRDEKWDEKWSLDGTIVVRQIAPNDDENYSRELRRSNDTWIDPSAPAPVAVPAAAVTPEAIGVPPPSSERPVDNAVMSALNSPVQEKIKDATGGTPFKVNLYSDDRVRWNRVKIDLDRDEKWDEKWTIGADGMIDREVAPADDEVYSESYRRGGDGWVRR